MHITISYIYQGLFRIQIFLPYCIKTNYIFFLTVHPIIIKFIPNILIIFEPKHIFIHQNSKVIQKLTSIYLRTNFDNKFSCNLIP